MKKASDILTRYFDTHNVHDGDAHADFFARWREIAGPGLCDHTQVVDIKNGVAIVYVDHPGWIQKLTFQKERILSHLGRNYPQLHIHNMLMKCVEPEQMGKPSVDLQRKQLADNMKHIRQQGLEAAQNQQTQDISRSDKQENEKDNVKKTIESIEDPEFQAVLQRLAKEIKPGRSSS